MRSLVGTMRSFLLAALSHRLLSPRTQSAGTGGRTFAAARILRPERLRPALLTRRTLGPFLRLATLRPDVFPRRRSARSFGPRLGSVRLAIRFRSGPARVRFCRANSRFGSLRDPAFCPCGPTACMRAPPCLPGLRAFARFTGTTWPGPARESFAILGLFRGFCRPGLAAARLEPGGFGAIGLARSAFRVAKLSPGRRKAGGLESRRFGCERPAIGRGRFGNFASLFPTLRAFSHAAAFGRISLAFRRSWSPFPTVLGERLAPFTSTTGVRVPVASKLTWPRTNRPRSNRRGTARTPGGCFVCTGSQAPGSKVSGAGESASART